jgi:hypothetical protein
LTGVALDQRREEWEREQPIDTYLKGQRFGRDPMETKPTPITLLSGGLTERDQMIPEPFDRLD